MGTTSLTNMSGDNDVAAAVTNDKNISASVIQNLTADNTIEEKQAFSFTSFFRKSDIDTLITFDSGGASVTTDNAALHLITWKMPFNSTLLEFYVIGSNVGSSGMTASNKYTLQVQKSTNATRDSSAWTNVGSAITLTDPASPEAKVTLNSDVSINNYIRVKATKYNAADHDVQVQIKMKLGHVN